VTRMASHEIALIIEQSYTAEESDELWRDTVRHARSSPPRAQRNQYRKIARSLRVLFESKDWHDGTSSTAQARASIKTN
jgi:hypothetical protein